MMLYVNYILIKISLKNHVFSPPVFWEELTAQAHGAGVPRPGRQSPAHLCPACSETSPRGVNVGSIVTVLVWPSPPSVSTESLSWENPQSPANREGRPEALRAKFSPAPWSTCSGEEESLKILREARGSQSPSRQEQCQTLHVGHFQ